MNSQVVYPFSAILGQASMKRGLILAATHPGLGGVLIRGSKGAAKSTAVRALAAILPEVEVFDGDPFHRSPDEEVAGWPLPETAALVSRRVKLVNLPIGSTDDRVVGSLDLEAALASGRRRFEPGLLASAHRGILYVDEINLLADHLVDLLLDAAAMGVNHVEREGLAFTHPSRFVLVGTMNPEEGELRPQLLDRFGLAVEAEAIIDPRQRAEVVRRRLAFDHSPREFLKLWHAAEQLEREKILAARKLLPSVVVPEPILEAICVLCAEEGAEGMRADLTIYKAASALAAYEGRATVTWEDVNTVSEASLSHRRTRPPKGPTPPPVLDDTPTDRPSPREHRPFLAAGGRSPDGSQASGESTIQASKHADKPPSPSDEDQQQIIPATDDHWISRWKPPSVSSKKPKPGWQGKRAAADRAGAVIGSTAGRGRITDLSISASLRAASPWQVVRGRDASNPRILLRRQDLRQKVRLQPALHWILFCVDASRSMGARERMGRTKAAVLGLLVDAYQKRSRVGLIAFGKGGARLVLPPTRSVRVAARMLTDIPIGGATPLAAGLSLAARVIATERRREPGVEPLLVLLTDGRGNLPITPGSDPIEEAMRIAGQLGRDGVGGIVIDTETGPVRLGLAQSIAFALNADYRRLSEIEWREMPEVLSRLLLAKGA